MCYTIPLAVLSYFILPSVIDLGDVKRFVTSGISYANPMSSTELTEMIFGLMGAFLPEFGVVILGCIITNLFLQKKLINTKPIALEYLYFLILPNTIIWLILPTKEMLIFISVITFLIGVKRNEYFLIIISALLLIIYKPHIFLPVIIIMCLRYLCLRFKQKFIIASTILVMGIYFAILFVNTYHESLSSFSLTLSYYFRTDANLTRSNMFVNEYDYLLNIPKGIYLSLFTVLPSEMLQSPKFTILFWEGLITVGLLIYFIHKRLKNLFDILSVYSVLVITGIMQYPLSIFNAGAASRYRLAITLAVILMIEFIRIKNLKRSQLIRARNLKNATN